MADRYCPNCGTPNPQGACFCARCATKLPPMPEAPKAAGFPEPPSAPSKKSRKLLPIVMGILIVGILIAAVLYFTRDGDPFGKIYDLTAREDIEDALGEPEEEWGGYQNASNEFVRYYYGDFLGKFGYLDIKYRDDEAALFRVSVYVYSEEEAHDYIRAVRSFYAKKFGSPTETESGSYEWSLEDGSTLRLTSSSVEVNLILTHS